MKGVHISPPIDTCVICGCVIPEGRQICPSCEKAGESLNLDKAKSKKE